MPSRPAVELVQIAKRFRGARRGVAAPWWRRARRAGPLALHPLDLRVEAGQSVGILGPNGSGKSTLVRIIATLLLPDGGRGSVFGHDLVRESLAVRRHLNRVSAEAAFFKELSARENLVYGARLYGGEARATGERVARALDELGLPAGLVDGPVRHLSRGQQQRVAIARSLLTTPSLLLLDEPTTGLDPRSRRDVQQLLGSLRSDQQVTILLCTHDLEEALILCDRVLLMDRGRLLADGTPEQLGPLEDLFFRLTGRELAEADADEEMSA